MKVNLPDEVKSIIATFESKGFEIYIVGGAVRDLLTKKPVVDWDYTTNANPDEIQNLFGETFYDNRFGTVGIPSQDPDFKPHEITTFRSESSYSDSRRPDSVTWGKSIEDDLQRRDFTINAMALKITDLKTNTADLIDLYGGSKDLDNKLVRSVGNPHNRFSEDALRLMRAIRFATELDLTIENETLNAVKSNAALINKIAKERVRDELFKIFKSPHPKKGIELLRESGLLGEILPEAEKMFGVDQVSPQRHHIYDVGTHALMSLKYCNSQDPITRFATFIHDIGKPQTFNKQENGVITFYNHEIVGAKIASRIADRLRFSKSQKDKFWRLVRYHQFTVDEHQTDSAVRRFIRNVRPENINDVIELRRADRLGSGARETSWRTEDFKKRLIEVQKQPFTVHDLKLTGHDVMDQLKLKPGPEVGQILTELYNEVVEKKVENDRESLLAYLKKYQNS